MNEKKQRRIFSIFIAAAIGMVLVLCFFCSINTDEMYTINAVEHTWGDALAMLKIDVHPPLYYFGLKLWITIFGEGIVRMHLFSAIGFIVMALMSFWVLDKLGMKVACYYFCFLIGNPFIFQKATELRMYDWLSMWCILNGVFTYSIIKNNKKVYWIGFVVSGLGAAYTQYYGIFAMICTYAGLLILLLVEKRWKDVRIWCIAAIATVIGYLPWLPTAIAQVTTVSGDFWIKGKESRLGDIRELFVNAIPNTYHVYVAMMILFPVIAVVMLIFAKNKADREDAWWSLICTGGLWLTWTVGMLFIILKERPILVSRYYVASVFLLMFGSMIFIKKLPRPVVGIICAFFLVVGIRSYSIRVDAMIKDDTRNFVKTLAEYDMGEDEDIYYMEGSNDYIWRYLKFYLKNDYEVKEYMDLSEDVNLYFYVEPIARIEDETSISFRSGMERIGEYQLGEIYVTLYKK